MPRGIFIHKKHSEETKKKLSIFRTGKKASKETIEKIRRINRGRIHTEKSKKNMSLAHIGKSPTPETREKLRLANTGKKIRFPRTEEYRKKQSISQKGKKLSEETRKKMSQSRKGVKFSEQHRKNLSGEKNYRWKGGITPVNQRERNTFAYKTFRSKVWKRDDYTCQKCFVRGGNIVAHHVINFSKDKNLRLDVDNAITLCEKDHNQFHKIYGKEDNTREQLIEFLTKYND